MIFSNKKGFTLVEAMIAVVVLSVGMMGVISVINHSLDFVERTRQDIIATNIAREGMEAIYNMRDTNWVKWSGKKDKCWLKDNPLEDEGASSGCEDDPWMGSGKYIVSGATIGGQEYFKLESKSGNLDITDGLDSGDKPYKMCITDKGYWYNCPSLDISNWTGDNVKEGRFFRQIVGKGLYDKYNDTFLEACGAGNEDANNGTPCGTSLAKEYRFCSKVEYMGGGGQGQTELCGVITNFKQ